MSQQRQPVYPFSSGPNASSLRYSPTPSSPSLHPVMDYRDPPQFTVSESSTLLGTPSPPHVSHLLVPSTESNYSSRPSSWGSDIDLLSWGKDLDPEIAEPDDELHNPDPRYDRGAGHIFTRRGLANLGFLAILAAGLLFLFAGYPLTTFFTSHGPRKLGGYNLGGINATGQVPVMNGNFALIDAETPSSAFHFNSIADGSKWDLIFSDEFNTPNRTFYPGDDPYWEAVDLHYWQTGDMEYYDPAAVVTTEEGHLEITLSQMQTHGLDYQSGHVSSWNKFCFTGGYVEVNVSLPGDPRYAGLWPAIWMMGNLGRAGYGASLQGMWPYSYDTCDYGTLANQSLAGQPPAAMTSKGPLSYQQGQRLSACTCSGEPHPGPKRSDGTFVGRAAPELDILEASSGGGIGTVSQSCQFAPFDEDYAWGNSTNDVYIYNNTRTSLNGYRGGIYQEAVSAVSETRQNAWQFSGRQFAVYGVEYKPGPNGYITWVNDGQPSWTVYHSSIGPNPNTNISQRNIPEEPLYIIMNLGYSHGFGYVSPNIQFPSQMLIDYVRVYQDPNNHNVGCNPDAFPTEDYINTYSEAYTNPNLTVWVSDGTGGSYNQTMPKNRLINQC